MQAGECCIPTVYIHCQATHVQVKEDKKEIGASIKRTLLRCPVVLRGPSSSVPITSSVLEEATVPQRTELGKPLKVHREWQRDGVEAKEVGEPELGLPTEGTGEAESRERGQHASPSRGTSTFQPHLQLGPRPFPSAPAAPPNCGLGHFMFSKCSTIQAQRRPPQIQMPKMRERDRDREWVFRVARGGGKGGKGSGLWGPGIPRLLQHCAEGG